MDFTRIFDILSFQHKRYPQKVALAHQNEMGWSEWSTDKCVEEVNRLSAFFLQLGLQAGDSVAILMNYSNAYWVVSDLAIQQCSMVVVPLHSNSNSEEINYILQDAQVKCCIIASNNQYEKLQSIKDNLTSLQHIITLSKIPDCHCWEEMPVPNNIQLATIQSIKDSITETQLATIIYTSGTTGKPKGVMLSHANIVSNVKSVLILVPITSEDKAMSFLPLSHVFERTVVYTYIAAGTSIYFADPVHVLELIRKIKPNFISSVPRFLEKMYDIILAKSEKKNFLARWIINKAISLGKRYDAHKDFDLLYRLKHIFAYLLVYRHWRNALGGRIKGVVVGAAALQPHIGRLFSAARIKIREGYGMTETSPVIAFNRFEPGGNRFGTVGILIPSMEIKIDAPNEAGEGEILVKGPNVMQGYYKQPELTAEVLSQDGWFRTGDVGKIVHKRFLQITDRKKDIFKTTHGKYVAPQVIENHLLSSALIEQCMVTGANRPYTVVLIVPAFDRLQQWCHHHKIHWTAPQYMVINPKIEKKYQELVAELCESLPNIEKIRKVSLLFEPWTVESGELTHTLKLKLSAIEIKYKDVITQMYQ